MAYISYIVDISTIIITIVIRIQMICPLVWIR